MIIKGLWVVGVCVVYFIVVRYWDIIVIVINYIIFVCGSFLFYFEINNF